jgi:hypothetical protein
MTFVTELGKYSATEVDDEGPPRDISTSMIAGSVAAAAADACFPLVTARVPLLLFAFCFRLF